MCCCVLCLCECETSSFLLSPGHVFRINENNNNLMRRRVITKIIIIIIVLIFFIYIYTYIKLLSRLEDAATAVDICLNEKLSSTLLTQGNKFLWGIF